MSSVRAQSLYLGDPRRRPIIHSAISDFLGVIEIHTIDPRDLRHS
jgi:hypothetical protein